MRAEDYAYLYDLEESFWWFVGMREIAAALLDPFCAPARDRNILDAGCGTGVMLSWLARYAGNGRVTGIDLSHVALNYCRARGNENLAQASITDLPFADSVFNLLTSFDVIGQPSGERVDERLIGEMFRVLRPGGIAFVRVAAYEWMRSGHDEVLATHRRYRLGSLSDKMERGGFKILRATYANTLLLPVAAVRRLALKRIGLSDKGSDVKPLSPKLEWLNRTLTLALRSEAKFLKRRSSKLRAGLSVICIVEKPHG